MATSSARVLLAGEIGLHLEVYFIGAGLQCTFAATAAASVKMMQRDPFAVVVAPPSLPDLAGTQFAIGILEHFRDVVVLLYGDEPDAEPLAGYARQGRFIRVPTTTTGFAVADYVRRTIAGTAASSQPQPSPPPQPTMVPVAGGLVPTLELEPLPMAPEPLAALGPAITVLPAAAAVPAPAPVNGAAARASLPPMPDYLVPAQTLVLDAGDIYKSAEGAELLARVAELEAKNDELTRENASLRDRAKAGDNLGGSLADARRETDLIRADLQRSLAELEQARTEREQLRAELEAARGELVDMQINMATGGGEAQASLDRERAARGEVERDAQGLREYVEMLEKERDNAVGNLNRIDAGALEAQAKLDATVDQLDQARGERGVMRRDLDKVNAELVQARREVADLIAAVESHDDARAQLAADISVAQAAAAAAVDERDAARLARTAEERARVAADQKVARATEQLNAALAGRGEDGEVLAGLQQKLAATEQKLDAEIKNGIDSKKLLEHNNRKLEARVQQYTREAEDAKKKMDEAKDQTHEARQLRDDAELQLANMENQLDDVKADLEAIKAELAEAQGVIALATAERDDAKGQIDQARADAFDAMREKDEAVARAQAATASLDDVKNQAGASTKDVEQKLTEAQKQRDDALRQVKVLARDLAANRDELAKLKTAADRVSSAPVMARASLGGDIEMLEQKLEEVTKQRDNALMALTEASRKLMELEDERSPLQ